MDGGVNKLALCKKKNPYTLDFYLVLYPEINMVRKLDS